MPTHYTITSYDGNFTIDFDTLDTSNTALTLPGKDWSGWGEAYSNNFTHLLENFAVGEPLIKRTGQLWYDTSSKTLKVWNKNDNNWTATSKLTTPVNINFTGDVSGSGSYDGITETNITLEIPIVLTGSSGSKINEPNTLYTTPAIVVDSKGRITSISNSGGDGVGPAEYVHTFNSRPGNVTLTALDVTTALGFTPAPVSSEPITITSSQVRDALGFTPANDALVLHLSGGTMSGNIDMSGTSRISNLPPPISTVSTEAARVVDVVAAVNTKTQRVFNGAGESSYNVTVSSSPPSGGNDGDVWYRY